MPLYVVQARAHDQEALERAVMIRDGFSWGAFIFAQLWLLYYRLWIPLLIWVEAEVAFILVVFPHLSLNAALGVDFLAHVFIGFEGQKLRIAKGARRAALTDIVEGHDREAAEARFFHKRGEAAR